MFKIIVRSTLQNLVLNLISRSFLGLFSSDVCYVFFIPNYILSRLLISQGGTLRICRLLLFSKYLFIARSALYVRAHSQNWNVRACVCLSVWKVITFCEEDMRGNHVPVGKVVLNDRFLGFETFLKIFGKKSAQSVHINADCS